MLDHINELGNKYNGMLGVSEFLFAFIPFAWWLFTVLRSNPGLIRRSMDRLEAWVLSLISPEYRKANRDIRIRKLTEQLTKLKNFGEVERLEAQATLNWELTNGLLWLTVLLFYGGVVGGVFFFGILSILDKEIQKLPVHTIHMSWSANLLPISFFVMFWAILWAFASAGRQAAYLSPKRRAMRISRLQKKLERLKASAWAALHTTRSTSAETAK